MKDVIKTIQSRLARKGLELSRGGIRDKLVEKYGDTPLEEIDIDEAFNAIASSPIPAKSGEMAAIEKEELVAATATELNIELPIEAITQIANSIDWAIDSRVEMLQQLRSAINSWADYKLHELEKSSAEIEQETMQLFQGVNNKVLNVISADNERLRDNSLKLSNEVNQSVESFRKSAAAVFKVFEIPSKP